MFNINEFLKNSNLAGASDIHLKCGKMPSIRVNGDMIKVHSDILTETDFDEILKIILHKDLHEKIKHALDLDFTYELVGVSRYRINYCKDMGFPKLTFRAIPYKIKTMAELQLPSALERFVEYNNGIILVTGATGSGKSTTLAAMIDFINSKYSKHIITIEDPIEFIHTDKKSLITQRGLETDVESFSAGIKYALRQDPDVILVGEIRDTQTLKAAVEASETGHLVISTIHTNSAIATIDRITGFFSDVGNSSQLLFRLSQSMRGVISQKLLLKEDKSSLIPALEILEVTPTVKDYMLRNKVNDIYQIMKKGSFSDMRTMNKSLFELYSAGMISKEAALEASDEKNELKQMIRGITHIIESEDDF